MCRWFYNQYPATDTATANLQITIERSQHSSLRVGGGGGGDALDDGLDVLNYYLAAVR